MYATTRSVTRRFKMNEGTFSYSKKLEGVPHNNRKFCKRTGVRRNAYLFGGR